MLESTASTLVATSAVVPTTSSATNLIGDFFKQITPSGIIVGALVPLITLYLNHFLSRQRASEERKESFRLKVYELRIQAAQTAYQYIFKIYRARQKQLMVNKEPKMRTINFNEKSATDIAIEARDWLDGQAIMLGKKIYEAVYTYFNSVGDKGEYEAMDKAQKALESVIKKELINIE